MTFLRNSCVQFWVGTTLSSRAGAISGIVLIAAFPALVSAQVIISEFMYDAPGSDSKAEWVELQNTGTTSVELTKWKLNDGGSHVLNIPPKNGSTGSLSLEPGAYLVLASDALQFISTHPTVSVSIIDTVIDLPNASGKVTLLDTDGVKADSVSYSSSRGGDGDGMSLQEVKGKFIAGPPTPGTANSSGKSAKVAKEKTVAVAKVEKKVTTSASKSVAAPPSEDEAKEAATTIPAQSASAVVPESSSSNFMPWAYGALAVGVAGAGATFAARQKKKGEWDIEEIA